MGEPVARIQILPRASFLLVLVVEEGGAIRLVRPKTWLQERVEPPEEALPAEVAEVVRWAGQEERAKA